MLSGAELVERTQHLRGQELPDDAIDGVEGEPARRQIDLTGRRDDVRLVARVHDEGFTIEVHDGLKE